MTFRRSGCRAGRIAICGNCCGIVTEWYILMTRQDVLQGFAQIAQPMEPIRDLHRAPWRAASGVGPGTITADHFRLDIAQTLAICRSSRFDIAQLHAICRSSPFNGRGYAYVLSDGIQQFHEVHYQGNHDKRTNHYDVCECDVLTPPPYSSLSRRVRGCECVCHFFYCNDSTLRQLAQSRFINSNPFGPMPTPRPSLTCPRITPTIARFHDRSNHLALSRYREARRRRDGRCL